VKRVLILCAFIALAYGQQRQRLAVLPSVGELEPKKIELLTDKVREIASKTLPQDKFLLLRQDAVVEAIGAEEYFIACKSGTCIGELAKKANANYGARCDVFKVDSNLVLKFELYSVRDEAILETFTDYEVKDFYRMLAVLEERLPAAFKKMVSSSSRGSSPFVAGGISGVEKTADYELGMGKSYLVNLSTEPSGAILSFDGMPSPNCPRTPCKVELSEGNVRIVAALEQYEVVDTTVAVSRNNQSVAIVLRSNFGVLEIKPAYLDDVGEYDYWDLSINGKKYDSFENKFSPGNYEVKLRHKCYEDVTFKVGINKGSREVFDMASNIKLKKGGLILSAEKGGEPAVEPVFVNSKQVGDTPFSDAVPLCSEIEIGEDREVVNVELKHNEKVRYTYRGNLSTPVVSSPVGERGKSGKAGFWVGLGLEVVGAAIIYMGYEKNKEAENAYERYKKRGFESYYYRDTWNEIKDNRSSRNTFYVIGGIILASGIGVHIWF